MFADDFFAPLYFGYGYFGQFVSPPPPPPPSGSGWTFFEITPLEYVDYRSVTISIHG